jgi:hypothetical protein
MSCAPPLKTLLKKNGSLQISFHSTGISQEHVLHDLLHASHGSGDLASLAVISKLESVYARRSTVDKVGGSIPRSAARSMCWRLSSAEGGSVPHMSTWPEGSSIERSHNNTFVCLLRHKRDTHTVSGSEPRSPRPEAYTHRKGTLAKDTRLQHRGCKYTRKSEPYRRSLTFT